MTTKDEVRSTVETLRTKRALKLALEALELGDDASLAERDHAIIAIRAALASKSEALMSVPDGADRCVCGEPDTPGTHRTDGPCLAEQPAQQQDIPDLIAGALGVSRGTAYDMMREALAQQQSAERVEPVAVYVGETWCGSVVRLYEDLPLETPFYASQPASPSQGDIKPWMWLTEEQKAELVFELFNDGKAASKAMYLLTAHEAKLKLS